MHLLIAGLGYLGLEIAEQAAPKHHLTTLNRSGDRATHALDFTSGSDLQTLAASIPKVDHIIHCASSGGGGPEAYQNIFLTGTRLLKETFPGVPLLLVSSTSVYHQTDGSTVTEDSPAEPGTRTSQILLEAERLADTVTRLTGIYGPDRSHLLKKFLAGEATVEEDGRRILNHIHRDDAASAILFLIGKESRGIFNVADDTPLSQLETLAGLTKILDRPLPPTGPKPEGRKRAWTHKAVSNQKLRTLGWSPKYPSFLSAVPKLLKT